MSKERPILFNGPMVRAIINGRKTHTRRIVNPQPPCGCRYEINGNHNKACCIFDAPELPGGIGFCPPRGKSDHLVPCPYGSPGDRLWVRESSSYSTATISLAKIPTAEHHELYPELKCWYQADSDRPTWAETKWHPSIHMPRWASRIDLLVKNIRVERLQEISDDDAIDEGVDKTMPIYGDTGGHVHQGGIEAYRILWNTINGPDSWEANPFVWVIEFVRISA